MGTGLAGGKKQDYFDLFQMLGESLDALNIPLVLAELPGRKVYSEVTELPQFGQQRDDHAQREHQNRRVEPT